MRWLQIEKVRYASPQSYSGQEKKRTSCDAAKFSLSNESREQSITQLKQYVPYVDRRSCPEKLGSLSIDTVVHCQGDLTGNLVWSLTLTYEFTHWTLNSAEGASISPCNALKPAERCRWHPFLCLKYACMASSIRVIMGALTFDATIPFGMFSF